MLSNPPRLKYCGLTFVMSNPSRFDRLSLLTSTGGVLANDSVRPQFNIMQCDVRLADDTRPFLPDTKCIVLTGEYAMHKFVPNTCDNVLNEMRGSPLYVGSIPAIATYSPQDAADVKNYEAKYNEQLDSDNDDDNESEGDIKRFSNTKRSNYAFWFSKDIDKCKKLLLSKQTTWPVEVSPTYHINPSANEIINVLSSVRNVYLDFDMETDMGELNMLCFAFSIDNGKNVYSIPTINYKYEMASPEVPFIIRALANAIRHNTLVAHNGSGFDFIVLGYKLHIPIYKVYDTMLAQRRCYPEVEQSLGHCTSLWTYQRFHKDTDSQGYHTEQQMMDKLKYCAKDVFTMSIIRQRIDEYASKVVGLSESIRVANDSIRPYIICTLNGIRYSEDKLHAIVEENDRMMEQYLRLINILIGPIGIKHCQDVIKSKHKSAIASSNPQCADYFYTQLGYNVVTRTPEGKPACGKPALYKLALQYTNPVITLINLYRQIKTETGKLMFHPWKSDDGKVFPRVKSVEEL